MPLAKLFKSLLGSGAREEKTETLTYKNFTIEANPIRESSTYRTAGYIVGEVDGKEKRVQFIRADQHNDRQQAIEHTFGKGRQIIDEQGPKLLQRTNL